jgi:type IV pilus assembly protein PilB
MPMNDDLSRAVVEGGSALTIKEIALEQGMVTLRRAGLLNALRGKTSLEEILRVTQGD